MTLPHNPYVPATGSTPYCRRHSGYIFSSKLRNRVINHFVTKIKNEGFPVTIGKPLKEVWQKEAMRLGVRITNNYDWYMFWSAVCMRVILTLKRPAYLETYITRIRTLLYPDKPYVEKHIMKRSEFLQEIATYRELYLVAQIIEQLLVRAEDYAEEHALDHPSWLHETQLFYTALNRAIKTQTEGLPLAIQYPLVDNGGTVKREDFEVKPSPHKPGIEVTVTPVLNLQTAKLLAYSLLDVVAYVESDGGEEKSGKKRNTSLSPDKKRRI